MTKTAQHWSSHRVPAIVAVALAAALAAVATGGGAAAAQATGVHLVQRLESADGVATMSMWAAGTSTRMDIEQRDQRMMLIWKGGEDGSMTIVQHDARRYMVFDADRMRQMQQMMRRMPGADQAGEVAEDSFAGEPPTFTATGESRQVGAWTAHEYRVEGPDIEGELSMWFTEEIDLDYLAVMQQVSESISSMNMPMMQGPGLGDVLGRFHTFRGRLEDEGIDVPDGFPVMIEAHGPEGDFTMETLEVAAGPFPAETFEPPAGYERVQMPGMPY